MTLGSYFFHRNGFMASENQVLSAEVRRTWSSNLFRLSWEAALALRLTGSGLKLGQASQAES
jgi:hypothetical protein